MSNITKLLCLGFCLCAVACGNPAQKASDADFSDSVTDALSNASPSPSIAGPMQASRRDADAKEVSHLNIEWLLARSTMQLDGGMVTTPL